MIKKLLIIFFTLAPLFLFFAHTKMSSSFNPSNPPCPACNIPMNMLTAGTDPLNIPEETYKQYFSWYYEIKEQSTARTLSELFE
jgi:hypothetical protein